MPGKGAEKSVGWPVLRPDHILHCINVGKEMTPVEFAQFAEKDRKTKARHIAFGGYFYRDLYTLAEDVFDSIDGRHDSEFNRLPKKVNAQL